MQQVSPIFKIVALLSAIVISLTYVAYQAGAFEWTSTASRPPVFTPSKATPMAAPTFGIKDGRLYMGPISVGAPGPQDLGAASASIVPVVRPETMMTSTKSTVMSMTPRTMALDFRMTEEEARKVPPVQPAAPPDGLSLELQPSASQPLLGH